MAPVIRYLKNQDWVSVKVWSTGQHREMLRQTLAVFGLEPDVDLELMHPDQSLAALTSRALTRLDEFLVKERPDLVLAQGDTTTVMTCSMACFYRQVPFGHVEAGLRTYDLKNPFPEEFNRIVAGRVAAIHFAPTARARDALLAENVDPNSIHVTGNTVIDALLDVAARDHPLPIRIDPSASLILVTAHRRENFGSPLERICRALATIARERPGVHIVYPVHPNPNVSSVVRAKLNHIGNISLIPPLDYVDFVQIMKYSHLILTDSGGIQEEAPSLGKPVLVLREVTERPEAVEAGVARIVGTEEAKIVEGALELLDDPIAYRRMVIGTSPYGDGHAAQRIAERSCAFLSMI